MGLSSVHSLPSVKFTHVTFQFLDQVPICTCGKSQSRFCYLAERNQQIRGGLTEITQGAQQLFTAIEASTRIRRHLTLKNTHKMNEKKRYSVKNQIVMYNSVDYVT